MDEKKIIEHAKDYIEKLAEGINPLDGTPVNGTDVVCTDRIKRCLIYTADVLKRMIENNKVYEKAIYIQKKDDMKNEAAVLKHTQGYIYALANGVNPLTKDAVSDTDIVRNANISKCLSYTAGLLDKTIPDKLPFEISEEALENFEYSDNALRIKEITERINALVDTRQMLGIKTNDITNYLVSIQLLEKKVKKNGMTYCTPTKMGEQLGITQTYRESSYGMSLGSVLYSRKMQELIIKNISTIINKSEQSSAQEENGDEQQQD